MKKPIIIVTILLVSVLLFSLGFGNNTLAEPNNYYKIYLKGKYIGTIDSSSNFTKYIDKMGTDIKNKYGNITVYPPSSIDIKRVLTYSDDLMTIEEAYKIVSEKEPFTIKGYEYNITKEDTVKTIYVLEEGIFEEAIELVMKTFIGEEEYLSYKNGTQEEILATGTKIENVYLDGDVTFKYIDIPVDKTVYNNVEDLVSYLLYGDSKIQSTYVVKKNDTIFSIAFDNEISEEEFLLSNPKFSNSNNLLYPGQLVSIVELNPQVNVVVEKYIISDLVKTYSVLEQYDSTKYKGDNEVIQKGENGIERVTQNIQIINGITVDARPVSKVEMKPAINEIVVKGDKIIPNVGSLYSWLWPTDSGYALTSGYGYRIDPVYGGRALHGGIDIAGLGYGANIYASNNGTVTVAGSHFSFGNYVVINHNNGYYTLYAHMRKIASNIKVGVTVTRGQVLGYIGSTGKSTGPHLHFEVHKGCYFCRINPWTVLK